MTLARVSGRVLIRRKLSVRRLDLNPAALGARGFGLRQRHRQHAPIGIGLHGGGVDCIADANAAFERTVAALSQVTVRLVLVALGFLFAANG